MYCALLVLSATVVAVLDVMEKEYGSLLKLVVVAVAAMLTTAAIHFIDQKIDRWARTMAEPVKTSRKNPKRRRISAIKGCLRGAGLAALVLGLTILPL